MAYIGREEIKQAIEQLKNDTDTIDILVGINRVGNAIASLPTAEVEEIPCRCEKCKYWDIDNVEKHTYSKDDDRMVDFAECFRWSNWSVCRLMRYNDFCSCGERRADNDL